MYFVTIIYVSIIIFFPLYQTIDSIQHFVIPVHLVITNFTCRNTIEEFLGTINLCSLNALQLHGIHASFGLCNEEDMLHTCMVVKGDSPVRSIVTNWCWNLEGARQLGINANFFSLVQVLSKLSFSLTVRKHII